jgi:hypothetical protein
MKSHSKIFLFLPLQAGPNMETLSCNEVPIIDKDVCSQVLLTISAGRIRCGCAEATWTCTQKVSHEALWRGHFFWPTKVIPSPPTTDLLGYTSLHAEPNCVQIGFRDGKKWRGVWRGALAFFCISVQSYTLSTDASWPTFNAICH